MCIVKPETLSPSFVTWPGNMVLPGAWALLLGSVRGFGGATFLYRSKAATQTVNCRVLPVGPVSNLKRNLHAEGSD